MSQPNWHNDLRRELARQGLPRRYMERLMDELFDHAICLKEEALNMSSTTTKPEAVTQRLGDPAQLADAAGAEYRRRTWWGRHPAVTFLVGPIPTLVITWILSVLGFVLFSKGMELATGNWNWTRSTVNPGSLMVLEVVYFLWAALPFALTSGLICWMAARTGHGIKWFGAALLIVTVVAVFYQSTMILPTQPGNGQFSVGFGFPPWGRAAATGSPDAVIFSTDHHWLSQLLLAVAPLAIGGLYMWRSADKGGSTPPMTGPMQIPAAN